MSLQCKAGFIEQFHQYFACLWLKNGDGWRMTGWVFWAVMYQRNGHVLSVKSYLFSLLCIPFFTFCYWNARGNITTIIQLTFIIECPSKATALLNVKQQNYRKHEIILDIIFDRHLMRLTSKNKFNEMKLIHISCWQSQLHRLKDSREIWWCTR